MSAGTHQIEIKEAYAGYTAPIQVRKAVERLLKWVPASYLAGLRTVVLRNSTSMSHNRRRGTTWSRGKKVRIQKCRGLYHQKWHGEPAWIEVFVDNVMDECPRWLLRCSRFVADRAMGEVLFHEIGHHVHKTQDPSHKEREDIADKWMGRLLGGYLRRKYWYLRPVILLMRVVLAPFRWHIRRKYGIDV
jgi:hypothetical protein